jgi:dephospho-CoA kinase
VARLLADRGAVIVDADAIARELQKSGTPVFAAMVGRFGESIIGDDGELDREALAGRVFADRDALKDLNAIVHPAVREEMAQQIAAAPEGAIVILDIPLLAESTGRGGMEMVITVEADPATRIGRLVSDRGMEPEAAEARIAAQATEEQRTAVADVVIRLPRTARRAGRSRLGSHRGADAMTIPRLHQRPKPLRG